jgi:hypothetical protein
MAEKNKNPNPIVTAEPPVEAPPPEASPSVEASVGSPEVIVRASEVFVFERFQSTSDGVRTLFERGPLLVKCDEHALMLERGFIG